MKDFFSSLFFLGKLYGEKIFAVWKMYVYLNRILGRPIKSFKIIFQVFSVIIFFLCLGVVGVQYMCLYIEESFNDLYFQGFGEINFMMGKFYKIEVYR